MATRRRIRTLTTAGCGTRHLVVCWRLDDTKMTIVLHSTPATADDVAEILGVPKKRVKWLKRLMRSRTAATIRVNGSKVQGKRGLGTKLAGKKTKVSRAKAKKAAR